jgi:branched-chain amino acid transport system ATP-binding protein
MSLNVSNLTVHHGAICAVSQVSIAVPTGKLAAIIGANGAGKTTLLRTLSGLKTPTNGSIMWKGEKIAGIKPEALVRRGISHVSEGKSVIPELTVRENLELGAIWRRNPKESKESIDQVVSIFPSAYNSVPILYLAVNDRCWLLGERLCQNHNYSY